MTITTYFEPEACASLTRIIRDAITKKASSFDEAYLLMLAERTGLEPATPGVTGRYSNQLNYRSFSLTSTR